MAKPQNLCKLAKGKALGAFDGFVDTFNWLVDFCNNLKGEGEIDNSKTLKVDTSVPDAPVIRGGGGAGGMNLKAGSDTNITFTYDSTDGKYAVNVYYT